MEPIGSDVRRELGRFTPAGGIAEILEVWEASVGEGVAINAWPARVGRDGTLHVATSSSTWAFELGQLAPVILERLREALGAAAPSGLRFALGHLPEPPLPEPAAGASASPKPTLQHLAAAAEITAGMTDEELREQVAKAVALSLARPTSDRRF